MKLSIAEMILMIGLRKFAGIRLDGRHLVKSYCLYQLYLYKKMGDFLFWDYISKTLTAILYMY